MTAPVVLESPRAIPVGSHAVSFYATPEEAAEEAVAFLEGAPMGQAAMYWVADGSGAAYYAEAAGDRIPQHVGCVAILPTEQVREVAGKLRPVEEVLRFVSAHPEGVTAGADTLSHYWADESIPAHLEYEAWFDAQPRYGSRFLCPYALTKVPADHAVRVMRELGSHHSHVILSDSDEPGVRLLQLFIFETALQIPERLEADLGWAVRMGLVLVDPETMTLSLAPPGDRLVRDWVDQDRLGAELQRPRPAP